MKLYIAGRIAGERNFEAKFRAACNEVFILGYEPVDPCAIHDGCCSTWEQFMHHDIRAMLDCDGVYALRDWRWSKGATIEVQLALRLGKVVVYQPAKERQQ